MDIERMKRLLQSGIEAGNKTREVREAIKQFEYAKQDAFDTTAEFFKPTIDVQKSIDEKQDKLIEQIKKIN